MRVFLAACLSLVWLTSAARAEIDIKEVTSPGGLTAWLVEDHSIPFVALEIQFKGGASLDPADKRGVTYLMSGLLEEGTGDLDARGFARKVEMLAASFDYDTSDDGISISARFLTDTTDEAIDLLRRSITEPSFPQDAIERVRAQVLSSIASDQTDPSTIARQSFDALAFGDHPYGQPVSGTAEVVEALTRDDLVAAHRAALARDRVYISAVGDITAEQLGAVMDTLLGALPAEGGAFPNEVPFGLEPGVTVVEYDTPQSVALFGHPGLERDHPDFIAAFVINTIFGGGGFEARLMQEVREKRGLTYGIYSYLMPKEFSHAFVGQFSSANDRIAEAIDVVQAEWARIASEGVSQTELEEAKTYLTGAYPLRFDGNRRIANILVGMQVDDIPMSYVQERNDLVNALTLEEINRVASELFRPDELGFVVVGKPEGLPTEATQ
ncbi:M16 family metallopeptidase [Primorskyibacter sp. S187A]|uniref:M16 family metallopeptidase n=1 Tax=Primorskyibacter sp. S187A TaxID=3415130 RepID=UPI003C7BFBFC